MDYSDSSKSSRIRNKHKSSKNENKHHRHHDRDRTRDKDRRDKDRDRDRERERDRDRERERERDRERDRDRDRDIARDRHYRSKSRGSRADKEKEKEKRHKSKHSSKKDKNRVNKTHSNKHNNHSSYRDNNKDSGNSKSKHYSNKSHKSRSKYSSSKSSSSSLSSSRSSSKSSKQKGENTNNLTETQPFNSYMFKNIIPPLNQKYPPMNLMGFPPMMGGMIPMQAINIIDNQPDKIVKDQNFLNSEEKLFESIVNHEMSLKNLYSDCQFSEKLMGSLLFRNLKKLIFDSNTIIFTDDKNEEKESVPSINEIIDNRINNLLKEKYLKINFSGLEGIYNKIIEERKEKIESEKKIEKTK